MFQIKRSAALIELYQPGHGWDRFHARCFQGIPDISTAKNKSDFSIAARAGKTFDRTLIYGKAGWVWGQFDFANANMSVFTGWSQPVDATLYLKEKRMECGDGSEISSRVGLHMPPPPPFLRSGSSYIGGGHAGLEDLGSLTPGLFWIFFLFFSVSSRLSAAGLAGVTMGTTTSAVAYMASVKSRIVDLLMRLS